MVKNLPTIERSVRLRYGRNCLEDQADNTIVINASNDHINANLANTVYLSPVRNRTDYSDKQIVLLMYNRQTKEITESGEAATDIIQTSLQGATNFGNTTANTVTFLGLDNGRNYGVDGRKGISFMTSNCVGIANAAPQDHTLSVGSNLYVDDIGANVLVVSGNVSVLKDVFIDGNLVVNGNTSVFLTENISIKDAMIELGRNNTSTDETLDLGIIMHRPDPNSNVIAGFRESTNEYIVGYTDAKPTDRTFSPKTNEDIDVHIYGRLLTEANVGIINTSPIHTLDIGTNVYIDDLASNVLFVNGNVDLQGDVTITENVYIHEDLHITGNTYISGNVSISEEITISNNVYADKDLEVVGNTYVDGNVVASKDLTLSGNAYVSGNVVASKDLTLSGNAYVSGNVVASKDLTLSGNAYVSGNVVASKDLTLSGNAYVSGNVVASKDLTLSGNAYVTGNISVTDQLTITGNVYADKDFELAGNTYITGNVVASKDLTLAGNTYITGNVVASKDLTLAGNTYITGNVVASKDLTLAGNAYVSGNVEVTKSLIVSANTHLEGDNVFITHTMDFLDPTTAIVTDQVSNVQIRLGQLENVSNLASNPRENQVLRYVGSEWSNDYPQQNFTRVKNGYSIAEGRTLYKGNTVYVSATQNAGLVQVRAAQSHVASQMPCIGVVYEDIGPEAEGVILTYGILTNLNTTHLTTGGTVYVSNVYSGYHTSVKPDDDVAASPDLIQNLGICTRSHASSGAIFVTGIGRANDIPNAELITDYNEMNYVYVNDTNNDLKKITSANLNIPLTTAVSSSSNSVANAVTLRGLSVTTGDGFNGNVNIGGNVSISGLTNTYFPVIGKNDKYLRNSKMFQNESDDVIVLDTDVQISGNLIVTGTQVALEEVDLIIQDRIIDIANNNTDHTTDIGLLIEHPDYNIGIIHTGTHPHTLALGYTQNGYSDTKITRDVANVMTVDVWGNLLVQNTLSVNEEIRVYDGGLAINVGGTDETQLNGMKMLVDGDIKIGKDYDVFYVDVSEGSVGLSTTTPTSNLHIVGNAFITSNITTTSNVIIKGDADSTSKTTGALQVTGGVGVLGQIYGADCNFEDIEADTLYITNTDESTSKSTGAVKVDGGVGVATNIFSRSLYMDDYLTHIGDLNTKIGFPDVDTFTVTTNNLERVRVDSSGRVGIYTNTPKSNLHIVGNAFITSNITTSSNILVNGDASSTSITTGGIQVANGLGVKSNIHSTNVFAVSHITVGTSETSNALDIRGTANVGQLTVTGMSSESNVNIYSDLNIKNGGNVYISGNTSITGNLTAASLTLTRGPLKIGNLFSAGPGAVPGVGSVTIGGVVQALAFRTAYDSGYNTGFANTEPANTLSVGANAYINAYGTTILSITGNTVTTNLLADSHIAVGTSAPTHALDIRGTANVAALTADSITISDSTAATNKTSGALQVTGGVGIQGSLYGAAASFDGVTSLTNGTAATSKGDGALVVTGGVGISGDIYATNGNFEDVEADSLYITDTTVADSTTTGALKVDGGISTQTNLYVGNDTYITSNLNVDGTTLHVDSVANRVGIGKTDPSVLLDVSGATTISGVTSVTDSTAATSKGDGALVVTGGVGITGDIYAADATFDNLSVAADTDIVGTIGRAKVGYVGYSDYAGFAHYDRASAGNYALLQGANGQTYINSASGQSIGFRENNVQKMTLSGGNLGINETSPTANLHVAGGTIINSATNQTAKKTYSYTGDLPNLQTIADSTIKITFSNHTFAAKIIATLVESDNEVSTLSFECGGGNWAGNAPSLGIVTGPVNVFGNTNTNPWDATITTTTTTVSFKPTTNMADDGHYNVFIEYFCSNSSGVVTKITEGTTDVVTFNY